MWKQISYFSKHIALHVEHELCEWSGEEGHREKIVGIFG